MWLKKVMSNLIIIWLKFRVKSKLKGIGHDDSDIKVDEDLFSYRYLILSMYKKIYI